MQLQKILKRVLLAAGIVVILMLGLQVALSSYLNGWIKKRLIEAVNSEKTYRLTIGDFSFNIFSGNIIIKEAGFGSAKASESATYKLHIKNIRVSGASFFQYVFRKRIDFSQILLEHADISVYQGKETFEVDTTSSLYDAIKKDFKSLSSGEVSISNASIQIYKDIRDSAAFLSLDSNSIIIKGFKVDERSDHGNRLFTSESIRMNLNNIQWKTNDGFYTLAAPSVSISVVDSLLEMDSMRFEPVDHDGFFKRKGYQTDRFTILAGKLTIGGLHARKLIETGNLICRKAELSGLQIDAYRNKNYKRKVEVMPSLQEALLELPFDISVRQLLLTQSKVTYRELAEGAEKSGQVSFENLEAMVTGLENRNGNGQLVIKASADLMNEGKLSSTLTFPLDAEKTLFFVKGSLGKMNMTAFNKITEPNANVSIRSGRLNQLDFDFRADHNYAEGKLNFLYSDLDVALLNAKGNDDAVKGLVTFVANAAFIRKSNPGEDGELRKGKIIYVRDPQRFVFNYSWHAIFSGLKDVVNKKASS